MNIIELENIWKENDRNLSENTRINKEILRQILARKPAKRLERMKGRTIFDLLSPIILFAIVTLSGIKFEFTPNFYIGLTLFLSVYLITYIWDVKYFFLIRRFDLSVPALNLRKQTFRLEKYKIKITRIRYLLMPFAIIGVLLMLLQKPEFNLTFLIMASLMVVVFALSAYYRFRYSISERFKLLNKEIDKIENLEKN